jgi:hypothetical protein
MIVAAKLPAPPMADLTATVTLVLAGVTLALVVATVLLVLVTRDGTTKARADAKAELELLRRQFGAGHRPLLVDVLTTAPVPPDMGAVEGVEVSVGSQIVRHAGPTIVTQVPGIDPKHFDPRTTFAEFSGPKVHLSVPLRNVGQRTRRHRRCRRRDRRCLPRGVLQIVCRGDQVQGPWIVEGVHQEADETLENPATPTPPKARWRDHVADGLDLIAGRLRDG